MRSPTDPAQRRRLSDWPPHEGIDTAAEPAFDHLTALAAHSCSTPFATLSLIEDGRLWCRSRVGVTPEHEGYATAFSESALVHRDLFIVPDVSGDPRFHRECVTGGPAVRFFAGARLEAVTGELLGVLCVMDHAPRTLTTAQEQALRVLSQEVVARLELVRRTSQLAENERLLRTMFDSEPQCVKLLNRDGSVWLMNRAGLDMIEARSSGEVTAAR